MSSKVDGDTVAVTATVTEGSIGADDVELTITLRDSSDTMIGVPATRTLTGGTRSAVSAEFSDVPSGEITIEASADMDKLRLTDAPPVTILPKVELTLTTDFGAVTATARITDGILNSPVAITAHITGPGGAMDTAIGGLSSASVGGMETATFTGLVPGDWNLDSSEIRKTTPRGILLTIDSTVAEVLFAASEAEYTRHTLFRDWRLRAFRLECLRRLCGCTGQHKRAALHRRDGGGDDKPADLQEPPHGHHEGDKPHSCRLRPRSHPSHSDTWWPFEC